MKDAERRARAVPVSTGTVCSRATQVRGFTLVDARFPADLRIPVHTHDTACVTVVLEGEFRERLLRRERACARASILAKPPLEPHADVFGRAGSRQLIVELQPNRLNELYPHAQPWDSIVHARAGDAAVLARSLLRELTIADPASALAIEGLTLELLALVWRLQHGRAQRRPPAWLMHARERISDQFNTTLSVAEIAADAGVHPTHLAREFRLHFGESVGDYVRRLRVEWSKQQLLSTAEALACIAVGAGFCDQSHFNRWFKRQTGITPQQYRSAHQR